MKKLSTEAADDKIAVIAAQAGLTPGKVEAAYRGNRIREVGAEYGIDQVIMRALAIRWGVVDG